MRSPAAAAGGGGGEGLSVSLLEAFIEAHQDDVQRCLSLGISPATGTPYYEGFHEAGRSLLQCAHAGRTKPKAKSSIDTECIRAICCMSYCHWTDASQASPKRLVKGQVCAGCNF